MREHLYNRPHSLVSSLSRPYHVWRSHFHHGSASSVLYTQFSFLNPSLLTYLQNRYSLSLISLAFTFDICLLQASSTNLYISKYHSNINFWPYLNENKVSDNMYSNTYQLNLQVNCGVTCLVWERASLAGPVRLLLQLTSLVAGQP